MEKRNQFTFYRSFQDALMSVSKKRRLGVYEAVIAYGLDQKEPEGLDGVQLAMFGLVRPVLDSGWKKAQAGQLGGSKPKANRKQNESKGEIEKEIEIETEIETETEEEGDGPVGVGFEEFWDLYPVKVGKEAAEEAWQELAPEGETVIRGLQRWLRSEQWKRERGRFIPRAARFLWEKHYLDSPQASFPNGALGELGQAEREALAQIIREV